ncbi:MAG: VOC family protein [Pseudomonadota bacterium]
MTFAIAPLVPELWCRDFNRSLAFYRDVLGFGVGQHKNGSRHAYLTFHGAQIMLAHWAFDGRWEPWHPEPLQAPFGRGVNFQFMMRDVDAYHGRLRDAGVTLLVPLETVTYWRDGQMDTRHQFGVQDPDGYVLRFAETISTRPDDMDRGRAVTP